MVLHSDGTGVYRQIALKGAHTSSVIGPTKHDHDNGNKTVWKVLQRSLSLLHHRLILISRTPFLGNFCRINLLCLRP
jgi:hypothetical protein